MSAYTWALERQIEEQRQHGYADGLRDSTEGLTHIKDRAFDEWDKNLDPYRNGYTQAFLRTEAAKTADARATAAIEDFARRAVRLNDEDNAKRRALGTCQKHGIPSPCYLCDGTMA